MKSHSLLFALSLVIPFSAQADSPEMTPDQAKRMQQQIKAEAVERDRMLEKIENSCMPIEGKVDRRFICRMMDAQGDPIRMQEFQKGVIACQGPKKGTEACRDVPERMVTINESANLEDVKIAFAKAVDPSLAQLELSAVGESMRAQTTASAAVRAFGEHAAYLEQYHPKRAWNPGEMEMQKFNGPWSHVKGEQMSRINGSCPADPVKSLPDGALRKYCIGYHLRHPTAVAQGSLAEIYYFLMARQQSRSTGVGPIDSAPLCDPIGALDLHAKNKYMACNGGPAVSAAKIDSADLASFQKVLDRIANGELDFSAPAPGLAGSHGEPGQAAETHGDDGQDGSQGAPGREAPAALRGR